MEAYWEHWGRCKQYFERGALKCLWGTGFIPKIQDDTGTADTATQKNMVRNIPKQWLKKQNKTLRTTELLCCLEDQITYNAKYFCFI